MFPHLIGISGKKHSGKDTVFEIIDSLIPEHYFLENKKFADKLKTICAILTGRPISDFYDHSKYGEYLIEYGMTIRELQQKVGTEAMRDNINQNVWVHALFSDYDETKHWIITDVRFPNEAQAIKDRNGILIRINRPSLKNDDNHPSETSLDEYENWDYIINNNGTVNELKNKIYTLVEELRI
jgi:dephospho-CoA kinase